MATVNSVLNVAQGQVGYQEGGGPGGHDGNITKYWSELDPGLQGQPWCAAFQRWVNRHAQAPDLPVSNPYYCPNLVTYARQHGLWDTGGRYHAGDFVFFDWNNQGVAEHVGRVVSDDGHTITTIEGNTSSSDAGSQWNGGGVYRKQRSHGSTVMGALRYSQLLTSGGTPPTHPTKRNPFHPPAGALTLGCRSDKQTGTTQVHWVQWAAGVPCDGTWGSQTDHAVRIFQQYHRLSVDGVVGPSTRAALATVTH